MIKWLLGQDRIEYFIELGLALFVEKGSSFRFGFFFSKLNVFLFQFKPCSVGSLYNFPKKIPDEIFLVEIKIFHKLAFLNFVMYGHTVVSNFIYDFINNINFLVWSRFIVVVKFASFLYYFFLEVLIKVFAVMELSEEEDEFLGLGLAVLAFSNPT